MNNHCSTRYEQSFRHNNHTDTNQNAVTDQDFWYNHELITNCIKGCKAYTTYRKHTSIQLKLAFLKVVSFHSHYLTYTLQTYHHPKHRFMSCLMQMKLPSHIHTQERVQQKHAYNNTYIKFLPGQNFTNLH